MTHQMPDELLLRDGERIVIRPIRPADGDELARLHARLSPDSIYLRFFSFKGALSAAEIRWFTGIAEPWRFALVAVRGNGQLAGVARYEGQSGRVDAEIGLVVDDPLQNHGLGRVLLRRLVDVARVSGLASLRAVVLSSNTPMLRVLRALPLPSAYAQSGGYVEVTLDLTGLHLPDGLADVAAAHVADAAGIRATLP